MPRVCVEATFDGVLGGPPISISVDMFPGAGAIHGDIWRGLRDRDIIVADVTGENPNVMYELGVAAAIKPEQQVIIVARSSPDFRFRFDLHPLRHRFYDGCPAHDDEFRRTLGTDIAVAVLGLPFSRRPIRRSLSFPHRWDLARTDSEDLFAPAQAHRAASAVGLEFGSPSFPYGWLCVGNVEPEDVLVRMRFRFLHNYAPKKDGLGWCGIALRASSIYAQHSQLLYIRKDGLFCRTVPKDARTPFGYFDHYLGPEFGSQEALAATEWYELDHGLNADGQLIGLNGVRRFFRRGSPALGFRNRGAGKMLVQTWLCLVQIAWVDVSPAGDLESMSTLPAMTTDDSQDSGFPPPA